MNQFSGKAEMYAKYRPGYPSAILDILAKEIAFDSVTIVADIGSGTGLLSKVFLENGNRVFGSSPMTRCALLGKSFSPGSKISQV